MHGRPATLRPRDNNTFGESERRSDGDAGLNAESRFPDDPVGFIQDRVRRGRILWTYHVSMRLAGRFIPREAILGSVSTYELVEAYPEYKYLPAT